MSIVRLIVATRSRGQPASGKIIKGMPVSVCEWDTLYIFLEIQLKKYMYIYFFAFMSLGGKELRKLFVSSV